MTATIDSRPRAAIALEQTAALAFRSVRNTAREPGAWVPSIVFPLLLAAVYDAQFGRATDLPAFPEVDSFLQFVLPASILQGIAFNAGEAGNAMAVDIQTGFFDRLAMSPSGRLSIFVGRLAGSMAFSGLLALVLVITFSILGAPVQGGAVAAGAIVVIAAALGLAIGGFSVAVAIRTGSSEATQAMFPLIFVVIFVSSAFFPTELMTGWYQQVAQANPFTLIVDPTRRLALDGFSVGDFLQALAFTGLVAALSIGLAFRAYVSRLRRA